MSLMRKSHGSNDFNQQTLLEALLFNGCVENASQRESELETKINIILPSVHYNKRK